MGFSNKAKITQVPTRELPLDLDLGGGKQPVLIVRHAGESNPQFWSAALKQANAITRRSARITSASINESRQADAKLYARFCVVGWRDVFDSDPRGGGAFISFDTMKCEELLLYLVEPFDESKYATDEAKRDALAIHQINLKAFESLKTFVSNDENFCEAKVDGVELGKP